MTIKLAVTLTIVVGILIALLYLITPPASAIPTGYEFGELNCGMEAGLGIPSISVKTHIAATGDFLARHTNAKYSTQDLQATDIGYTSTDVTNGRYVLEYNLDQYYTDTTPSIVASHYLETSGSSISKEEAGIQYLAISENASNAVTPTSAKLTSGYTTMTTNGGTYAAETAISSSLAADNQPQSLSMTGETSGLNGEPYADGATFWDWSASYEHRLSNTLSAPNISGNESMNSHEIGMTGGKHATTYSFKGDVASRVEGIVFEDRERAPDITIPSVSDAETSPSGISPPSSGGSASPLETPLATEDQPTNTTTNQTANLTANTTAIQEELNLAGYNIANYNTANLHGRDA
jgi:hypothetical protein